MYDVVIIGAGPAGLFAGYELVTKNKKLKVAIIEKGSRVKNRMCPMNKLKTTCKNCKPCNILFILKPSILSFSIMAAILFYCFNNFYCIF